jgi:hypothetical protein
VAAVAAVGHDAGEARAGLGPDLRDHGLERVAVVGVARQRLGLGDEGRPGAIERGGDRDLDAELVGAMSFSLADAFDLGRVQRIDLPPTLVPALVTRSEGEQQRLGDYLEQGRVAAGLAQMSRMTRPR